MEKELIEKKKANVETDWNQLQNQRQILERQLQITNRQLLLYQRQELIENQKQKLTNDYQFYEMNLWSWKRLKNRKQKK